MSSSPSLRHFDPTRMSLARVLARSSLRRLLLSLTLLLLADPPAALGAGNPVGGLRIRFRTAPNFVVDSNVETPATYAPRSAYIGVQVCNESASVLENVRVSIGDYDSNGDLNPADSTPGVYPTTTVSPAAGWGYSGTFALRHMGGRLGAADAVRRIETLAPGECSSQWWLVTYPRMDSEQITDPVWNDGQVGNAVWGAANVVEDDLVLGYDVWASGNPVGGATVTAWDSRTATLRNEISANANKIWPNTLAKVPGDYLNLTTSPLGWAILESGGGSGLLPGQTFTMAGIWYDFGVVRQGFDNNGDFVPDYNAWMQPVGDPAFFDPGCFRPVSMQGVLIVKLIDGSERIVPFEDNLYFENLPTDNNGVVGLVYYTFMALDAPCSSALSPYQEVASGSNNEKFNGDFGALTGQPTPSPGLPTAGLGKTVSPTTIFPLPGVATWTISFTNTSTAALGNPSFGYPVVVRDAIPAGTTYRAGTAAYVIAGGTVNAQVQYSTNGGVGWLPTQPSPASLVTHLEWRLTSALPAGATGTVTFGTDVPGTYPSAVIPNQASLQIGDALPIATADATALVGGTRSVGDTVFRDDGAGTAGNGVRNAGELGLAGVVVRLYHDSNGNGILEAGDHLLGAQTTDANGQYLFQNLPSTEWIVVVDASSPSIPLGYGGSTSEQVAADTTSGNVLTADFGFAPALGFDKKLLGSGTSYEGQEIRFKIDLWNQLRASNGALLNTVAACTYNAYPTNVASGNFNDPTFALGAPELTFANGTYATTTFVPGKEYLEVQQFTISGGAPTNHLILSVEATAYLRRESAKTFSNDTLNLFLLRGGSTLDSLTFSPTQLNAISDTAFTQVIWNLTDSGAWDWASLTQTGGNHLAIRANKDNGADASMYLDAYSLRITTDCGGDITGTYDARRSLDPVRLVDTFDPSKLEFLSSSVPPTSVNPGSGEIVWEGLGPINPAGSLSIILVFRAKAVAGNTDQTTSNTATVTSATFADGRPANTPSDSVGLTLKPTGSISGYIWSDNVGPNNGWQGTTGYQNGEPLVAGVSVQLLQCTVINNSGGCDASVVVGTTVTDSSGLYSFTGLIPGGRYSAQVVTSGFVGNPTPTQTGDPDDDATAGRGTTGNGGTCGGGGGNVPCDNLWNDGLTLVLGTSTYGTSDAFNYTNINFGYSLNAALFGYLWRDVDADGGWDAGEPVISGVQVCLDTNNDGSCSGEATTTTTDSNGRYVFSGLAAGSYRVAVNTVSGTLVGATQTGDPDQTGVCTVCDHKTTTAVTLAAGDLEGPKNFGFRISGTSRVGDFVYLDADGDGVQDPNEIGIPGVTLRLYYDANSNGSYDPATDFYRSLTVTDAAGAYEFSGLPSGVYFVVLDETTLPGSYPQTDDPDSAGTCSGTACDGRSTSITLTGTNTRLDIDFGYQPPTNGYLGDVVYRDLNGNGEQDGIAETGIDGITVWLCPGSASPCAAGSALATTVTTGGGSYQFSNLPDGSYKVAFDTGDAQIPEDFAGNSYVPSTPVSYAAVLVNGLTTTLGGSACAACNLDADFGLKALGAIGDFIFYDANRNGALDVGEAGIPGVRVFLCAATAPTCNAGSAMATQFTSNGTGGNATGSYLFQQLAAGSYQVAVDASTLPAGMTAASLTSDPDADGTPCSALSPSTEPPSSVCDGVTGSGGNRDIVLGIGTVFSGADFGYAPPGVIGDRVWLDLDQDGLQDTGEQGVADVRIWIDSANAGVLDWTDLNGNGTWDAGEGERWVRTNSDGYYFFENVSNGTQTVALQIPAWLAPSKDGDAVADGRTTIQMTAGLVSAIGGNACSGCDLALDFGLKLNGSYSLAGNVCLDDVSGDGACSGLAGEQNLAGIAVYLYDSSNRLVGSTLTTEAGIHSFSGLANGVYKVVVGTTQSPIDLTVPTTSGAGVTQYPSSVVRTATISNASLGDVDFAFAIDTPLDFGDLPDSYRSTLANDGARHVIPPGGSTVWLGTTSPDAETNAQAPLNGSGDGADEDGVTANNPTQWVEGPSGGSVIIQTSGAGGWLVAWIDFNQDGDFLDTGEMVVNQAMGPGAQLTPSMTIPTGTLVNAVTSLSARFRIFSEEPILPSLAFLGEYSDGEVEDYVLSVGRANTVSGNVALDAGTPGFGGDTGIGGVRIDLYGDADGDGFHDPEEFVATTYTDGSGNYSFTNVPNGNYLVVETDPVGATDVTDRDGNYAGNGLDRIHLSLVGADSTANDFLETGISLGSLSGHVYDDGGTGVAGNGSFGADTPLQGVMVTLYRDANEDGIAQPGEQVAQTSTDSLGAYAFAHLSSGNYLVVESDPAGFFSVTDSAEPTVGNDDNTIAVALGNSPIPGLDFLDDAAPDRDYADLPDLGTGSATGDYRTLAADSGPSHLIYPAGGFRLGAAIDAEADGLPTNLVSGGDDATTGDDEDGVTFPGSLVVGTTVNLTVNLGAKPVAITPRLNIWFDFNRDGDFTDPGEQVATNLTSLSVGNNSFPVALPPSAVTGAPLGVRVRLADADGIASTGAAGYGEVEDYLVTLLPLPTAVVITEVTAGRDGDRGWVVWRTGYEAGTVGFRVTVRRSNETRWSALSEEPTPASRNPLGGRYEVLGDGLVSEGADDVVWIAITEIQVDGSERTHGPFEAAVQSAPAAEPDLTTSLPAAPESAAQEVRPPPPPPVFFQVPATKKAQPDRNSAATSGAGSVASLPVPAARPLAYAKLETVEAGTHYVSAADLALATGRPRELLERLIRTGAVGLTERGRPVEYLTDEQGTGLFFQAEAATSLYSNRRIYWLAGGRNPGSLPLDGGEPSGAGTSRHRAERRFERNLEMVSTLTSDPSEDCWIWDALVPGNAVFGKRTYSFQLADLDLTGEGDPATLVFELVGGDESTRRVRADIQNAAGTHPVGEVTWSGRQRASLKATFNAGFLVNGPNQIVLRAETPDGARPGGLLYTDSYSIHHPAFLPARGGLQEFRAWADEVIRADGFGSAQITVLDVTEATHPRLVVNTTVGESGARFHVRFAAQANHRYSVFEPGAARPLARLVGTPLPTLAQPTHRAEYVLIAPDALVAAAGELAQLRGTQGLTARVISLTDIANEFGGGVPTPDALAAFVATARSRWAQPPRYLVLVGNGTADYRDFKHAHDNLVPPAMVSTRFGLFASDVGLGDAGLSVGRLPVVDVSQLQAVIAKIREHESRDPGGPLNALVGADRDDGGGAFSANARALGEILARKYQVRLASRAEGSDPSALRADLLSGLSNDLEVLAYTGHGAQDRLGPAGYLSSSDVASLGNTGRRLPLLLALTCAVGNFAEPGNDSLAERLILQPGRGAIAAVAPTGLSDDRYAQRLGTRFLEHLAAAPPGSRLGDLLRAANTAGLESDPAREILQLYNLIGDPALRVR